MEKVRVTLFILIVILTWLIYSLLILPKYNREYHKSGQKQESINKSSSSTHVSEDKNKLTQPPEIFDKSVELTSDFLKVELAFSDQTIKVDSVLLKFQDNNKNPYHFLRNGRLKLGLNNTQLKIANFALEANGIKILFSPIEQLQPSLLCSIPEDYILDCQIEIENANDKNNTVELSIDFLSTLPSETHNVSDIELIYGYLFKDITFKFKSKANPSEFQFTKDQQNKLRWVGLKNKYFVVTFINPVENLIKAVEYKKVASNENTITSQFLYKLEKQNIVPKSSISIPFKMFFGPKQKEFLLKYKELNLDWIYNFGFFDAISKFLFVILQFIYDIFRNYGVAIIFLTLLVRLALFPVAIFHQRSIYKLQLIQPLIEKIKEKYKDNTAKMQSEFRKLYQKYKINPMMGCLPLFIQIPILFSLFNLFNEAIELRGARFFLWMTDLSQPDKAINLNKIFLGDNYLHILPILNVIVWVGQIILSKQTSPTTTPSEQEKSMRIVMYLMPFIFGFALYSAPSGLNLYWLFTTLFSIVESLLIKKIIKKEQIVLTE
jgi:YidC/Oxa1 family membrane protein insertase